MAAMNIPDTAVHAAPAHPVSAGEAFRVWLKIGLLGFGGPAGQIALMHRILVEEKRWIGEARFLHALNYCMLLPGPEAQQLATYVGWLLHRTAGGIVAGTLFVLPGALVVLALSVLYAGFQELTFVQAIFFGIKAAVLAVVVEALHRIARRALRNGALYALAAAAFVAIFFLDVPFPLIVIGAAVIGLVGARLAPGAFAPAPGKGRATADGDAVVDRMFAAGLATHTRPSVPRAALVLVVSLALWLVPVALLIVTLGADDTFSRIAILFSKLAVVTFGGAYAVLAYLAQAAVEGNGWLSPGEMLDGLGLAETTPGPLILVTEFVGFLAAYRDPHGLEPMLAGAAGAALVLWVTFVPCFLWIFLGAPWVEAIRENRALASALTAITAAVVGVVLNLAVWFGLHVVFADVEERTIAGLRLLTPELTTFDPYAAGLAALALVALFRLKLGMIATLFASAAIGALIFYLR